ncbi:cellulase family glycosylhydrolase [Anditalea andensis]|uniref:Glycoside hydrolase family 5 domain-containing protein n=1 Tax=Anditalea andensis TaxID=1048983 RepID=A0A074KZH7_9BACT|nr:cellulase family glycosylhydrolase [Anditalea andensis]KEO75401.1 hypothetical protein EL17_01540 [Anditalea andensis]
MQYKKLLLIPTAFIFNLLFIAPYGFGQDKDGVFIDGKGIMRWAENEKEVKGFGINYTAPFAHAFTMAERMGIDKEKAIDEDVYHFARLGLDLYRIHVWDTEISDTLGNLINNDRLHLFDYTIHKMKERGMKFIITPIAYWGGGWPEPDVKTPGFAHKYGKDGSLIHPDAIKAQQNYLAQFVEHVNPYTGIAYKNDPDIIALEISNEPHHPGTEDDVTLFINSMVEALRSTGTKKQIFYNITQSVPLKQGFFNADIQGLTFQWYPTNLMAMHELKGNFLPQVDVYNIPFADHPDFPSMAKIVYEFDPADIGASYIYPAMARSFRTAGMQLAAQFSYDPLFMAHINTEYGTHYMNLAYTPQKALSLKIAHAVFHDMPLYKEYGKYPQNASFENFQLSYEKDLAEYNTEEKFYYTNHTRSNPKKTSNLKEIAGYGNSPLVEYSGTGAYFLDKLDNGIWRLEVMPDAIWISDPFGQVSPDKEVAVVNYREQEMSIKLPDLEQNFVIRAINEGNDHGPKAEGNKFTIKPGVYILNKNGQQTDAWSNDKKIRNIRLNEFVAPKSTLDRFYVLNEPQNVAVEEKDLTVSFQVISKEWPEKVSIAIGRTKIPAVRKHGYEYEATISSKLVREGFMDYHIVVEGKETTRTFPSDIARQPSDWDFYAEEKYRTIIVRKDSPIHLFEPLADFDYLMKTWNRGVRLVPSEQAGAADLKVDLDTLPSYQHQDDVTRDYSMRVYIGNKMKGRIPDLELMTKIRIEAETLYEEDVPVQIALISTTGETYGGIITITSGQKEYTLSINELSHVPMVNLPRPYPGFINYYFESPLNNPLDLSKIEGLQISVGPGINEPGSRKGFVLQSISLVK